MKLLAAGKGVSLRYGPGWLANGFALSEDLPLVDTEHAPPGGRSVVRRFDREGNARLHSIRGIGWQPRATSAIWR